MFRHYLVAALRNFAHHKLYGFINIVGLSIGLACSILIALYVRDQLSYDKWIPHTRNLYRLEATFHIPGLPVARFAMASFPVVTAIGKTSPQVKAVTHMVPESMTVIVGRREFGEKVTFVDPNFFRVIQLPLVRGDPAKVLEQPESVVISQRMARKYFGEADPIGKILTVSRTPSGACDASGTTCRSGLYPLTVTGVLRDLPHNTQLLAELVVPNTSRADRLSPQEKEQNWMSLEGDYGYIKLRPGADPGAVLTELKPILNSSWNPHAIGVDRSASEVERYRLTPFLDVHLASDKYGGMTAGGSWAAVYGLSAIALLILSIACFNVINLSTARATLRAREIALRKMAGARRRQLIAQFLLESILTTLISLVIALALVEVLLPLIGRLINSNIHLAYGANLRLVAGVVAGAIALGLVSGAYPALVISAFHPAPALKAGVRGAGGPGALRAGLVVAQFAISIGLGIVALVVFNQIDFMRSSNLGFKHDGVVIVRGMSRLTPSARKSFAATLSANPQVLDVSYSNAVPFDLWGVDKPSIRAAGKRQVVTAYLINAQPDFPTLYGARLISGRLLSPSRGTDVSNYRDFGNMLINATGARRLGFTPEEAIGRKIDLVDFGGHGTATIVGVLKDMKLRGMEDAVDPVLYYFAPFDPQPKGMTMLSVRVRGDHVAETLSFIDKTWHAFAPDSAIDRYFLNAAFDRLFQPEAKQGEMLGLFVGVAIFIACLGLFGLAVFTAERRTKEIGVRKVAGARTGDIVKLMLWRISVPVLVSNVIAWPAAYMYLRHWLDGYAYRIGINPLYFIVAGAVALLIAWGTVYGNTLRLARTSPIHALRYE